jgi:phosphatidylethanolamine/phosphatidyl-N-methylethanolamine N-methyltransferase
MRRDDRERAFWERKAPHYDRVATGVFGRPLPRVLELTAEIVSGAGAVLEVAAGTGLMTAAIAPRVGHLVATDYADAMLERLRERVAAAGFPNVECTFGDIYALDYPPGSFDRVVAGNVLHLVPDLPGALQALCRVLRPGGMLIAPTFCHDETRLSWFVSRTLLAAMGQPMHRRFTAASLREALEREGLRVTRLEIVPGVIPITHVESICEADWQLRSRP